MNSRLLLFAGSLLLLSALGGALLNLYGLPESELNADTASLSEFKRLSNDWQAVLSQLPQFVPPKKTESVVTKAEPRQPKISDGLLVAIVADKPRSAVVIVSEQNDGQPMQLAEGDSWLEPWEIDRIETDFVVWHNSQTDEQYTQTLFPQGNESDKVQE
ncbi:hypothetical protein [Lacimicrobium alkaliphilum]|uniref:Uncharacterized protein n=1 Tax=Lacimicrobium alkaliphilum TaxID=1526571 RepID=A0A0U3ADY5_9ALTE|nr:hypothetical protein [Lacimicrobium alkaliphilum]ALS99262.1 hypothetical protein AT746_14015 [Lacimicrobium alkaliphilum]